MSIRVTFISPEPFVTTRITETGRVYLEEMICASLTIETHLSRQATRVVEREENAKDFL